MKGFRKKIGWRLINSLPNRFEYGAAVRHVPVVLHVALPKEFTSKQLRGTHLGLDVFKSTLLYGALKNNQNKTMFMTIACKMILYNVW